MMMFAAFAAALFLTWGRWQLGPALVAAVVLGLEVAFRQGWVRMPSTDLPLNTLFAITIAVCGYLCYQAEGGVKLRIAAATTVALVGAMQTLAAFKIA